MSKVDILAELPRLSPEDRAEIQIKLDELSADTYVDADVLTDADKRLIEDRLNHGERNPSTFVPWTTAKSQNSPTR
jgi:hypothetical protein